MKLILKNLNPFQKIEFISMLILAITIPMSWRLASYSIILLFASGLLKGIFEHGFKHNPNQYRHKISYFIFCATFIMYLIGMIYSKNLDFGWIQVEKKLIFLLLPLYFLFSDLSYLDKKHLKLLCYAFTITTALVFLANLSWASYDYLFKNASIDRFFIRQITKIYHVHHTYMAMYACLGIVFCFTELFNNNKLNIKILNAINFILLVIFVVLLNSRAGILCMLLLFIILWIWIFFIKKQKIIGTSVGCTLLIICILSVFIFPSSINRITKTIKDITSEEKKDIRVFLYNVNKPLLYENWLFGVGTGDRCDETNRNYCNYKFNLLKDFKIMMDTNLSIEENKVVCMDSVVFFANKYVNKPHQEVKRIIKRMAQTYSYDNSSVENFLEKHYLVSVSIEAELNAHNQYFETIISIGIIGLLLMLSYFVIPIVLWIKNKNFDILYFSFVIIIAFNALFESIFETQTGIMFFMFFNVLFFHVSFCKSIKK